ncbi:hypothetical protein GIB67_008348 [Kingdonia uniflora]|uniref:Tripeptidyl peptidase II second Ig-like domain-containing protein n=1 Tax=Kingdonia uniflora TaxID=39325 RepID=A0A7J7N4U5_9MAGN|nr:hypothetical protein GIB67_008348 [Kingdonia uniflora]
MANNNGTCLKSTNPWFNTKGELCSQCSNNLIFWFKTASNGEVELGEGLKIGFHGININREAVVLDGSEAPVRIESKALLSSEKLVPNAILNKIRSPYRPIESKITTLPKDRDKLPSGRQILALTLIYKFKLEEAANIKPHFPLLNNRVYDTKFESQFYMISDSNKHVLEMISSSALFPLQRVHTMGDVYPKSTKLPKGEYTLQFYLRHDNVQYLEKMKQLVLFVEKKLEEKDFIRLSFFSQPDGPVTGSGNFTSSVLIPGVLEAFYVAPPTKEKIPKSCQAGSVLLGAISYGNLTLGVKEEKNPLKQTVSYQISYLVPPKIEDEKIKESFSTNIKNVSERLKEEVRDAKIKFFGSLKQNTEEERSEWKELCASLKSEYPNYTPLLAKILEDLLSRSGDDEKIRYNEEVIDAANEVVASVDKDDLAKYFSVKSDPEDEEAEEIKKKMETTREQLAQALYQKGIALAVIDSLKHKEKESIAIPKNLDNKTDESIPDSSGQFDMFEKNFKELKKWVDMKSPKYCLLLVLHEKRSGRLGTALKTLTDMIQEEGGPPRKKLYDLKLSLLEEIGWKHVVSYEKQWMHVRFPSSLPLF